jgi:hypothetical protein
MLRASYLVIAIAALGCNSPSEPAPAAPSAPSAPAAITAKVHAFHYDVVVTTTEGTAKSETKFSLDLADGKEGSASVAKNIIIGANARSDVGTKVKAKLTMEGEVPKLELDVAMSAVDAAGKVYRLTPKGAAATPLGKATTIIAADESGKHIELSATPSASTELGAEAKLAGAAAFDVTASAGAESKALSLSLAGDAPVVANQRETKPLVVGDGGAVVTPRQDTGTRVKVSAFAPRADGIALDFDIEISAVEPATPAARIRKIMASGRAFVPYEKEAKLFTADEDGQRYSITGTLHRPK